MNPFPLLASAAALVAFNAHAGALDECMTAGDHGAVTRCLVDQEAKVNAELADVEAAAAKRARAVEVATGRAGPHAALAKSVRDFAAYRSAQCTYVKELMSSGSGAAQAHLACRVDLTRRRIRELTP